MKDNPQKKSLATDESAIEKGLIHCNDVRLAIDLLYKTYPDSKRFENSLKVDMINKMLLKDTGVEITERDFLISTDCNASEALLDLQLTLKNQGHEDYSMYDDIEES